MIDLDLVTDGWWEWDLLNPERETFSDKFWTTLGYNPADMPSSPSAWQNIIHPEDAKRAEAAFLPHVEDGEPYHMLVRYKHFDGHWVWIVCRGQAVFEDGVAVLMTGAHQDVTKFVNGQMLTQPELLEAGQGLMDSMAKLLGVFDG
jgi:PAS domain S-box-containing protein